MALFYQKLQFCEAKPIYTMLTIIKSQALQVMIYTAIIAQVVFSCGNNQDTANSILNVSKKRPPTVVLRVQPFIDYEPLILGKVYSNTQIVELSFYISNFNFMGAQTESENRPILLTWRLTENKTVQTTPDSIAFALPSGTYNDFAFQIGVDSSLLDSIYCVRQDTIFKASSPKSRPRIDKIICAEEAGIPYNVVTIRGFFDSNNDGTTETPFEYEVQNNSESLVLSRYHGTPVVVSDDGKPVNLTYRLSVRHLFSKLKFNKHYDAHQIIKNLDDALLIQE